MIIAGPGLQTDVSSSEEDADCLMNITRHCLAPAQKKKTQKNYFQGAVSIHYLLSDDNLEMFLPAFEKKSALPEQQLQVWLCGREKKVM